MGRPLSFPLIPLVAAALVLLPAYPAAQEDAPEEPRQERPAKPLVIPAAERNRKNPIPPVPEAIASGKSLFLSQCSMCHGRKADGRGDLAIELKLAVPDLTDPKLQAKRTDGEWLYIISHGHRTMPPEKRLVDQQKWEIILHLRTVVPEKAKP